MRIAVAALLLVAAVTPLAWAPCLSRAAWPLRAPRAGIAAWLACPLSAVVCSALAGLVLAIPCAQLSTDPAALRACLSLLRAQYTSPAGAVTGVAGGLLAVAVVGRLTWFCGAAVVAARRRRAAHDDVLAVIAKPGPAADVRVIDGDRPAVYCLPGRRRIVLTTVVGFFAVAARQIAYLVEIAADDAAGRRAPRLTVASALLVVATAGVPAGALGAGGSAAAHRIQRLIYPPSRDSRARRAVTCLALVTAATLAIAVIALACVTRRRRSRCRAVAMTPRTAARPTGRWRSARSAWPPPA